MKKRLPPLLAILALTLFTANVHAVEYQYLKVTGAGVHSNWVAVPDGKQVRVVLFDYATSSAQYKSANIYLKTQSLGETVFTGSSFVAANETFKGPCEIKISSGSGATTSSDAYAYATALLKIEDAQTGTNATTQYASVIPENLTVDARVRLQQSTDLINWTDVAPGEFAPSATKRFFRVTSELVQTAAITGTTSDNPIVITANAHGFTTGDQVEISGVQGNTTANGTFTITEIDANSFSLNGADGSSAGTYSSGGTAKKL